MYERLNKFVFGLFVVTTGFSVQTASASEGPLLLAQKNAECQTYSGMLKFDGRTKSGVTQFQHKVLECPDGRIEVFGDRGKQREIYNVSSTESEIRYSTDTSTATMDFTLSRTADGLKGGGWYHAGAHRVTFSVDLRKD